MFNSCTQYIAGNNSRSQLGDNDNGHAWFYSPMDCVSKWSKALKQGVTNSMGLEKIHTASTTAGESEKPDFSLFLAELL